MSSYLFGLLAVKTKTNLKSWIYVQFIPGKCRPFIKMSLR